MESIYVKKDVLSNELCNLFIKNFKESTDTIASNFTNKTDLTFDLNYLNHPKWSPLLHQLIPHIHNHLHNYINENITIIDHQNQKIIPILNPDSVISMSPTFNMQYYKKGEAFHQWHAERMKPIDNNRVLVWMVYLNDVTDQGGTEFYHQKHTERAEQGKIVLFSSDWMHTHRGIPSPTQEKFILTGWLGWY
tara:strand:- start:398 stop:973 length:576 start_codon:yes stop_codon:yes gene_type:complete